MLLLTLSRSTCGMDFHNAMLRHHTAAHTTFFSLAATSEPVHRTHTAGMECEYSTAARAVVECTLLPKKAGAGSKIGSPHRVIYFYEALHVLAGYLKLKKLHHSTFALLSSTGVALTA
jgi:hypothetical protein